MNTRFNVLSVILIFLLSLVVTVFFFSSSGFIVRRTMNEKLRIVENEIKEREGTLNALRYRASGGGYSYGVDGELVYSFSDDDIFDPVSGGDSGSNRGEFRGISNAGCLLVSLLVTLLYCILILLVVPRIKRKGVRHGRHNRV